MFSIGPMECLFSKMCAANLDFPLPYLKSQKCSWTACGESQLVNSTVIIFTSGVLVPCCQKFFYGVVCAEPDNLQP